MACDISGIIADFSGQTEHADAPGIYVPTLTNGTIKRIPLAGCAGCTKAVAGGDHKCWRTFGLYPASASRAQHQELADADNAANEKLRKLQRLIQLTELCQNGVPYYTVLAVDLLPPASVYDLGVLTSVSGTSWTVEIDASAIDPTDVEYSYLVENPAYGDPGEPRYLTVTNNQSLLSGGIAYLSDNSFLGGYGKGKPVGSFTIPAGFTGAVGDTYTINLDAPTGSKALTLLPSESGDVRVGYRVLMHARNPWFVLRDTYPLFCARMTKTIDSPTATTYPLWTAKIRAPETDTNWFLAYDQDGNALNLSAYVLIDYSDGAWSATLDLTSYTLTGITSISLIYFVESDSAAAICAGQNRCANSVPVYDANYGQEDTDGRYYICTRWADITAGNQAKYQPDCYLYGTCAYYVEDKPTNPFEETLLTQLAYGASWMYFQQSVLGDYELSKLGPPSLASLAEQPRWIPAGYHATVLYDSESGQSALGGGCTQHADQDVSGTTVLNLIGGLEHLYEFDESGSPVARRRADGTEIDFQTSGTWPTAGPGAGHISGKLHDDNTAASATTDPYSIHRRAIPTSGKDYDCYDLGFDGTQFGKFQRFRSTKLYLPQLAAGPSEQDFGMATFRRGYWTAAFVEQVSEDVNTVYYWLVEFTSLRYDITQDELYGGTKFTGDIYGSSASGGYVTIEGTNRSVTCATLTGPSTETTTSFPCGGTWTALPEWARLRNYSCWQSMVGHGRNLAVIGDGVKFTDATLSGSAIYNKTFLIDRAEPCCGTAQTWTAGDVTVHANSLPYGFATWGNLGDELRLVDENGVVTAHGSLAGLEVQVVSTVAAKPGTFTLSTSTPAAASDTTVSSSNYSYFAASGQLYGKVAADAAAGNCLIMDLLLADRTCRGLAAEYNALFRTYENIVGG